jgi:hypothetical protein
MSDKVFQLPRCISDLHSLHLLIYNESIIMYFSDEKDIVQFACWLCRELVAGENKCHGRSELGFGAV